MKFIEYLEKEIATREENIRVFKCELEGANPNSLSATPSILRMSINKIREEVDIFRDILETYKTMKETP